MEEENHDPEDQPEMEESEADQVFEDESEGRSFNVSEGEAVHAAEEKSKTGDKLGSVAIALIFNVAIFFALSLTHLA